MKHSTELSITADQTTKLQALADEFKKNHPKPGGDNPSGNNPAASGGGQGGQGGPKGPPPELMEKISAILTPDQMAQLKALHDKAGDHPKPPKPTN